MTFLPRRFYRTGRLTKKSSCGGCGGTGQAIYSYDDQDRVTGVRVLENDPMAEVKYDVWSRVTKIRAPIGSSANEYAEAAVEYNGADAVTKATDPRGYSTTFLYDTDRQLTKVTDARGKTWQYGYDLTGAVTKIIDPNSRNYAYAYDATGALAAQADPLQKGVFYYYQTDANTKTADLLITRTVYNQGNNGILKFGYDDMQRLTSVRDGADVLMTSVMQDVAGRVTKQDDGAAWGNFTKTYTYDSDTGALTRADDGYMLSVGSRLSKHTLSYDHIGRPTNHYFGSDNTSNTHRMRWQYSYDDSNAGRLTGIASSNDDGLTAGSTAYAYEDHGLLSRTTLRNGAYADYLYDRGGRLTRLANYHSAYDDGQGTTRRLSTSYDYTYDANSNMTEISQDFMGAEVVTQYAYDEINRLTREATCDFMNRYFYDEGGNRTKLVHMNAVYSKDGNGRIVSMLTKASASTQGLTKTYLYANYTELTKMTASEYGGTTRDYTYEHDMAGRLTRQIQNVFTPNSTTTYNYEWDAFDRMTKVQRVASGVTKIINYTYNAAGLRVRRVDTSTSVTKLWTYQGNNIASVSTKSGGSFGDTSTQEWVYTVAPGIINNVLERLKANYAAGTTTSEYYQYDHRGNVAAVTDADGKILRGYQYDAFGNIPFSFATGQSGAAPTDDILFTGKDLDPDTGLYYFNARWYDADLGRFLSQAVLGREDEHPYLLCEGAPLSFVDCSGLNLVPIGDPGIRWDSGTPQRRRHEFVDESLYEKFKLWLSCMREHGCEPTFTSIFRTRRNNDEVRGDPNSGHMAGIAFDIDLLGLTGNCRCAPAYCAGKAGLQQGVGGDPSNEPWHFSLRISGDKRKRNAKCNALITRNQENYAIAWRWFDWNSGYRSFY